MSRLTKGLSAEQILELEASVRGKTIPDKEDVIAVLSATDSYWEHPGDAGMQAPHAELTAGDCSDGFINLRLALSYPNLVGFFAKGLVDLVREEYGGDIDWVVGSDTAATGLSFAVAQRVNARWYPMQKGDDTQSLTGVTIPSYSTVLHVEELMTTAKTSMAVRAGVRRNNETVKFVPLLSVIVHRPAPGECEEVDGSKVLRLGHFNIQKWAPADCPLCANGSKALRPSDHKNWRQMVESMAV